MKKYCLLENGEIKSCYYLDRSGNLSDIPRPIKKEKDGWYINIGVFAHSAYITTWHKILKFADTREELVNASIKNHSNNRDGH